MVNDSSFCKRDENALGGDGRGLDSLHALTEAILKAARHGTQVAKASSSGSASSLRLGRPVVSAFPGVGIATCRASLLLDVIRTTPATHADGVRLASTLSIT